MFKFLPVGLCPYTCYKQLQNPMLFILFFSQVRHGADFCNFLIHRLDRNKIVTKRDKYKVMGLAPHT